MQALQAVFPLILMGIFFIFPQYANADTIKQTMDGSMDVEITYPDSTIIGRDFSVSVFLQNNGWEDKQDIEFFLTADDSIRILDDEEFRIERLSSGGSYGITINFHVSEDASQGIDYINILYSQVLVSNNEKPLVPTNDNLAIPILIKDQPKVTIHTITPESIFANAEFPFEVEILSEDVSLKDVSIQIIAPDDVEFRGQSLHTFSSIQQNIPVSIIARIITSQDNITTEHKIPFEIIVKYTDDIDSEEIESKVVPLLLRPRTFMELTTDGGIWIGDFFLAPYVSLGTIIGIPAGTILSLAIRRSQNKKKRKRKK